MAIKQKYINDIAYLFKKKDVNKSDTDETPLLSSQGTPFRCNVESKSSGSFSGGANFIKGSSGMYVLTTTQLNFEEFDVIAFTDSPRNDVEQNDFNTILSIEKKPYMEKGNRSRNIRYYEYKIKIS